MTPEPEQDLSQITRQFRPALMAFFLRRLRNHAMAEDMTQEVFARLARNRPPMESPNAYIFQMAANLLRNWARHEQVRAEHRLGLGAIDGAGVEEIDPDRVLLGRENLDLLAEALKEMPARTRTIFLLSRLERMKRGDIADIYGMSVSGVEKHIAKAMELVTRRLEVEE